MLWLALAAFVVPMVAVVSYTIGRRHRKLAVENDYALTSDIESGPPPPSSAVVSLSPRIAENDAARLNFFKFTTLCLDELPVLLRLYFRRRWEVVIGTPWANGQHDGSAFWDGVFDTNPWANVNANSGSNKVTVVPHEGNHHDVELLAPGDKVLVGLQTFKIMSRKNATLFLNDEVQAPGSSVLQLRGQTIRYERNADSRMAKRFRELILTGDCDEWDISLLCFALVNSSHELMHGVEDKIPVIEALRDLRNRSLAHVRSCRMTPEEMMMAVAKMDSFVSGCLSTDEWSEWKAVSRQVLQENYTQQNQVLQIQPAPPHPQYGTQQPNTLPLSQQQAQASSQQLQQLKRDQDSHRKAQQQQRLSQQQSQETSQISCPQQLPQVFHETQHLQTKELAAPNGAHFTNMQRATVGAQFGVFRKRQESICQQFWQKELMD